MNPEMNPDLCVPCGDGILNIRAGAIILRDGKVLMAGNERKDYLYSVGGRLKLGETAAEAVVREVLEETGVRMEVDRLGFLHENYFYGDSPSNFGRLIYEISFFFYMKVPENFEPACGSATEDGDRERLRWVAQDENVELYPAFFKTELQCPAEGVKHFVTRPGQEKI